jgi:hypothetical protein
LQKSIADIKVEKEKEIQSRNEMIAHLKDRLQELKAKKNMESKYVKKSTDNSVAQTKKKCDLSEGELKQQIEVDTKISLFVYFYRSQLNLSLNLRNYKNNLMKRIDAMPNWSRT